MAFNMSGDPIYSNEPKEMQEDVNEKKTAEIAISAERPSLHLTYSQATSRRPSVFVPQQAENLDLNYIPAEFRPFKHKHVFKRPRPLQYSNKQNSIPVMSSNLSKPAHATVFDGVGEERSRDNLFKQLGRLELFIDLVWVGIISSISNTFSKRAFAHHDGFTIWSALLEFILLFVPLWRLWDYLRSFGSNFYNDGVLQRFFMCWILFLAVVFGINAPFALTPDGHGNSLTLLIGTYLVARVSFLVAQMMQCFFMPFLWRQFFVALALAVLAAAIWIPAYWVPHPAKLAVLLVANVFEQLVDIYLYSPLGNKLITGGWEKVINVEHYIVRHESFFILIVGDGVSRLITDIHAERGLNALLGTALNLLLIYYLIHWLYFDGDQTKEYVHALRWKFWKAVLWQTSHLVCFASLLLCSVSNFHLVAHYSDALNGAGEDTLSDGDDDGIEYRHHLKEAFWTSSICLAVTLASMTCITLLNKPLDKPKTLVINSRYIRLAPRLLGIVVIVCLPLFSTIDGAKYFGAQLVVMFMLFLWEWFTGLEREWKWFESREE